MHSLVDENYQEHAHAWTCSVHTDSVLTVSWCSQALVLGDGIRAHSAACAFIDEISPDPNMEHGTYIAVYFFRTMGNIMQ